MHQLLALNVPTKAFLTKVVCGRLNRFRVIDFGLADFCVRAQPCVLVLTCRASDAGHCWCWCSLYARLPS